MTSLDGAKHMSSRNIHFFQKLCWAIHLHAEQEDLVDDTRALLDSKSRFLLLKNLRRQTTLWESCIRTQGSISWDKGEWMSIRILRGNIRSAKNMKKSFIWVQRNSAWWSFPLNFCLMKLDPGANPIKNFQSSKSTWNLTNPMLHKKVTWLFQLL